jgi:hypothetical protein
MQSPFGELCPVASASRDGAIARRRSSSSLASGEAVASESLVRSTTALSIINFAGPDRALLDVFDGLALKHALAIDFVAKETRAFKIILDQKLSIRME